VSNEPSTKVNKQLGDTGPLQTLAKGAKLTVTVERVDGGKLRCTGATWSDAVVIFPGEVLAFQNIERQAHALRAPAPGEDDLEGGRMTGHFTWCGACGRSHSLPGGQIGRRCELIASEDDFEAAPTTGGRHPRSGEDDWSLPTRAGTPRSGEDDFEADKLTLTVERAGGGKLRCTSHPPIW
jgi:hypothetical protein